MRGQQERTGPLFSYISTEDRIPVSHPLRQVRRLSDQALDRLNPTFCRLYLEGGLPSIPPEQLLLALLLQAIYGIRSERMLIEELVYNLLFCWFVGLNPGDPVWHPTSFTKNRDRLLIEELMTKFLELLLAAPEGKLLLLSNQTNRSSSDAEARLIKKAPGVGAFLSFMGHCVMENRNGLVVAGEVSQASGTAERDSALRMGRLLQGAHQKTLGADKGYDTKDFVGDIRINRIMPHVAQNIQARRRSAIAERTTRHQGYAQSINAKRLEQVFGWIKQAAGLRQLKARGRSKVGAVFRLHGWPTT
jgi:transposase